jgi:hypothetical protein
MRKISLILFLVFITVLAVGCTSATPTQQPTPQQTPTVAYPPPPQATIGYPAPGNNQSAGSGYPGPGGAPALEARANVKVELVAQSDDPANPAQVILKVKLVSATPVEGSPDRFTALIGQNIDLHATKEGLPALAAGDTFTADVTYRGDEANSVITAENIQK